MVDSALTSLLISFLVFIAILFVVSKERRRGRRFFATGTRGFLDGTVQKVGVKLVQSWEHFSKYIIQLNWYYSIHSVLKGTLKILVKFYTYFENIFERNRKRTKELRAEKRQLSEYSHLQQMSDHKEETTLSPAERRKLMKRHLDGKV